jgi:hypothetical protein
MDLFVIASMVPIFIGMAVLGYWIFNSSRKSEFEKIFGFRVSGKISRTEQNKIDAVLSELAITLKTASDAEAMYLREVKSGKISSNEAISASLNKSFQDAKKNYWNASLKAKKCGFFSPKKFTESIPT